MARSPFSGTYAPNVRPVVVTAPDAFVMINNNTQVTGCPVCNSSFDINKYITSIQVDLSIDSVPGSASIACSVPRHTIDTFFFDNDPVITPMMEVNIYAKGFYLVQGLPQYYPIFWGLVTSVNDSYSGGEHSVSIHCADILKWFELCRMNMNPSMTLAVPSKFGGNLYGNIFAGMNPFDIIWNLARQSYGDIIVGAGSLDQIQADSPLKSPVSMSIFTDMMAYWSGRFQNISKNLMLYGMTGVCVRGDVLQQAVLNGKGGGNDFAERTIRTASGSLTGGATGAAFYDPMGANVFPFRPNKSSFSVNVWNNEFQTKLELANAAKDCIGYEFFMDVTGDIVFKPPFYNLDVLSNKPVSWIQDIDVIEWDLEESEGEVITQLTLSGNQWTDIDASAALSRNANVVDYHLLRQYGWRPAQMNSEWMVDQKEMFWFGLDYLDRTNAKRHHGTVSIPFRPELRLGVPIYLASKDQIWYVQGISHNIAFGGRATTSLTLIAKREKFKAPQGIGALTMTNYKPSANYPQPPVQPGGSSFPFSGEALSQGGIFQLKVGSAAVIPVNPVDLANTDPSNNPYTPLILRDPLSGTILGYPNAVMVYLAPYDSPIGTFAAQAGNSVNTAAGAIGRLPTGSQSQAANNRAQTLLNQYSQFLDDATSQITNKYITPQYPYTVTTAGQYIYAHDLGSSTQSSANQNVQGVIGEMVLLAAGNLTTSPTQSGVPSVSNATVVIRPVSDDRGFEVVGHYRYGRGVSLSDGQLVIQGNNQNNQAANVALQVALSGNLYASLTAQSQGLTAVTSPYGNPIDAIANLQPTDLQTSGFSTPTTDGTPGLGVTSYGNTQTNFATLSVYGSPQQQGVFATVEASQLSQGLTLAEMTVVDNSGALDGTNSTQPQCSCLLGRSDLAFITAGYQVQTLGTTTPDASTLSNPNSFVGGGPVSLSLSVLPPDQVQGIIDNYLFGIYSAADAPHQAYEQQLRGGIYQSPQPGANGTLQVGPQSALGATAPPFSPSSQAAAGNPLAIAQMASSAVAGLSQAWSSFSSNLKTSVQISSVSQQLANNQSNLASLQALLAGLQTGEQPHGTVGTVDLPGQIASLQSQITTLQQTIANEEGQLGQLRSQASSSASISGPIVGG
jgi:hypothetical protein